MRREGGAHGPGLYRRPGVALSTAQSQVTAKRLREIHASRVIHVSAAAPRQLSGSSGAAAQAARRALDPRAAGGGSSRLHEVIELSDTEDEDEVEEFTFDSAGGAPAA